jgi:NAD-dependent deacetylase
MADSLSRIVIVCGAGISADSGIPTYRNDSVAAPWIAQMQTVCTKGTHFNPESREFFAQLRALVRNSTPNAAHRGLAAIQAAYGVDRCRIFTQNVDDLLERAGCTNVEHVHGAISLARCTACSARRPIVADADVAGRTMCSCAAAAPLRTDVVFYGEPADYAAMIEALVDLEPDDIFVLLGTSCAAINVDAIVRPIRCRKIYVNPAIEPAVAIDRYAHVLQMGATEAMPQLIALVGADIGEL